MPEDLLSSPDSIYHLRTNSPGPPGSLPLTDRMLREWPSGDLFGLSQNAGMGWNPSLLTNQEFLLLSTAGGLRADDGSPIALGYRTGHWEVALQVRAAAEELRRLNGTPFAAAVTDPCDEFRRGTLLLIRTQKGDTPTQKWTPLLIRPPEISSARKRLRATATSIEFRRNLKFFSPGFPEENPNRKKWVAPLTYVKRANSP